MVVDRVLVDIDSNVNDLYYETFTKLGLEIEQLKSVRTPWLASSETQ